MSGGGRAAAEGVEERRRRREGRRARIGVCDVAEQIAAGTVHSFIHSQETNNKNIRNADCNLGSHHDCILLLDITPIPHTVLRTSTAR